MEWVIQAVEYSVCIISDFKMSFQIKVKYAFFLFFQQERDYKNGSLSSYASLWSVSIFTIFSSTCDWNTRPLLLLGYVSRNCSLAWTRKDYIVMLEINVWSFRLDLLLERERDICTCAVVPLKLRPSAKIVTAFCLSFQWLLSISKVKFLM